MPHFESLFESRFVKGIKLERPITIRILSILVEELEGEDGTKKPRAILKYRTAGKDGKPVEEEWVINKTNAILASEVFGNSDYTTWAGRTLTIGFDPTVMLKGERVGGIRVVGSPELKQPITVEVKRPRRKKVERYTLNPTDAQGRVRGAATATEPATAPVREREAGEEG